MTSLLQSFRVVHRSSRTFFLFLSAEEFYTTPAYARLSSSLSLHPNAMSEKYPFPIYNSAPVHNATIRNKILPQETDVQDLNPTR